MQKWVVLGWALLALLALVCAHDCPDGDHCEDNHTCCSGPENGYGCCPFHQAECCEDHIHCCPEGTLCNVQESGCVNATGSFPWAERVSAGPPRLSKSFRMIRPYLGEDDDNICPDLSRCPPEFSCLRALTSFGCCPLAQGVSCSDGKHCCPEGHQCSADSRSCIKKELVSTVMCSDGKSECPEETTCCEDPDGSWGCCPMPKAVCCEDKTHCCPEGSSCDVQQVKCISLSTNKAMPMWAKLPARKRADWENQKEGAQVTAQVMRRNEVTTSSVTEEAEHVLTMLREGEMACNVSCDSTTACPDKTTCCKTAEGGWACCGLPEAVCCEDHVHCCPHGNTCDLASQTCQGPSGSVPAVKKVPAYTTVGPSSQGTTQGTENVPATYRDDEKAFNVSCDSTTACPDQTTCCKTAEGGWACCGLPEAVCCEDHVHCCPHGNTCDLAAQTCQGPPGSVPAVKQVPAYTMLAPSQGTTQGTETVPATYRDDEKAFNVSCDSTTACPDQTTCCKTAEGGWACCGLPEAVCCEDHVHCCPHGNTCDLAAQTCQGPPGSVPAVKQVPAYTMLAPSQGTTQGTETVPATYRDDEKAFNVSCDSTTACPDQTTCCKTAEGGWACCGLPEAVCCEDHVHCCPHGNTCDLAAQTCQGPPGSVPAVKQVPAYTTVGSSSQGTTQGTENVPATYRDDEKAFNVSCDSTTACPDQTTCCKTAEGGWACCGLPEAVCCEDHVHCCPHGYTCDLASQKCNGPSQSLPMVKKVPTYTTVAPSTVEATTQELAEEEEEEEEEEGGEEDGIPCDQHTICPKRTTCCFMDKYQKWGCCPLPEAVCCKDGDHCCPQSYSCNANKATCHKGEVVISWYNKLPATNSLNAAPNSVGCDVQNTCPEHSTCCQLSTGQWGCCPLHEAVCCPDMEHCCPQGYSCNMGSASCLKATMLQLQRVPSTRVNGLASLSQPKPQPKLYDLGRVQCEGQSNCKYGETCCRTSTTTWGCCPSPNAVCCSDMKHCCPTEHTCNKDGSCSQNTELSWDNWQQFFFNKKRALLV